MNSLKVRLLLSTLVMTVIMLPIIGFTLSSAFERQLMSGSQNELKAYSYSILTVAEVENNELVMPELLLENQFNVSQSGLYAVITPTDDVAILAESKPENRPLWQSQSLLTLSLPTLLPSPIVGETLFSTIDLEGSSHLLFSFSVSFFNNGQEFPITLHIIKDQENMLIALSDFRHKLWGWLLLLIVVFVFVQLIGLLWTLKPLRQLTYELEHIEKGQQKLLKGYYPLELQKVVKQLNTLLVTEENQRKRYRNALSDLAHSLKTPLAIMQSEKEISVGANEQLQQINQIIEHQLKRAQSSGQLSWYLGVEVKAVIEKLVKTLEKLYKENQLCFTLDVDKSAIFRGDEGDLMEILGNILDNACKAAKSKIVIKVYNKSTTLTIEISDDGAGINQSQQAVILSRGGRADTYQAGHGIGLAIVNDLVSSYQGQLFISKSATLGGATFTLVFDIST
ncbi:ATP-binding protein [Colwellia sp. 4_MG-2023]|uniref:ATP-binding protein n=1 Tax=unclassified Colwellia TaxID=196834 RepID=UPI001C09E853|nr:MULTISPECIES: ATP-binding protein [unclassified Colwellia]MBU2925623.1 GHKL domain-containing protein [Colwellia sp. C2M11]MDO6507529.1 ATP-binding protein [Colwellia sp. 5_MG-2023]MDO6556213.1 ATP-binding protein [Colwellia sp. 4_MG-2023]MDO6651151.1 ATP-binding protein [Colwellia sp. 3_MG-2023]MDO6666445.1 ATP-binding protein [Colwellia sp. 2_MG-2023]